MGESETLLREALRSLLKDVVGRVTINPVVFDKARLALAVPPETPWLPPPEDKREDGLLCAGYREGYGWAIIQWDARARHWTGPEWRTDADFWAFGQLPRV